MTSVLPQTGKNSYKIIFRFSSSRIFKGSVGELACFVQTKREELQGRCTSVKITCNPTGVKDEYEIVYSFISTATFVGTEENRKKYCENELRRYTHAHFSGVSSNYEKLPSDGRLIFGTN